MHFELVNRENEKKEIERRHNVILGYRNSLCFLVARLLMCCS